MNFMDLAKARFSTRKFTTQPVEDEKLAQILEAGKLAPTAKNQQPQKIYVIRSREKLDRLNQLTRCIYGAGTVLLVAYDDDLDWDNPMEEQVSSGEVDAAIVATHMMLEATELGLGSVWVGWFPPTETAKALGLPANIKPVMLMPLGYTADTFQPSPMHSQYRETSAIVTEL